MVTGYRPGGNNGGNKIKSYKKYKFDEIRPVLVVLILKDKC